VAEVFRQCIWAQNKSGARVEMDGRYARVKLGSECMWLDQRRAHSPRARGAVPPRRGLVRALVHVLSEPTHRVSSALRPNRVGRRLADVRTKRVWVDHRGVDLDSFVRRDCMCGGSDATLVAVHGSA
jgi:hypothetical protein